MLSLFKKQINLVPFPYIFECHNFSFCLNRKSLCSLWSLRKTSLFSVLAYCNDIQQNGLLFHWWRTISDEIVITLLSINAYSLELIYTIIKRYWFDSTHSIIVTFYIFYNVCTAQNFAEYTGIHLKTGIDNILIESNVFNSIQLDTYFNTIILFLKLKWRLQKWIQLLALGDAVIYLSG